MQKTKAIMQIKDFRNGELVFSVDDYGVRAAVNSLVELCNNKHGGYIKLEMSAPYKSRTTGPGSQNNLAWKLITLIAQETGNDLCDIEDYVKLRAVKRGYPAKTNKLTGQIKPASMTEISTVEASYLIEELYQLGAELGINLE